MRQQQDAAYDMFLKGFRRAYSRLNYSQFCVVLGEPEYIHGLRNAYVTEHWHRFLNMAQSVDSLGTYLENLVKWGMEQDG